MAMEVPHVTVYYVLLHIPGFVLPTYLFFNYTMYHVPSTSSLYHGQSLQLYMARCPRRRATKNVIPAPM